ncbi:hypothetical protein NX722_10045 [Endozoicomonas gorgoniicola]|uniref:Phage protein n=1 Tax=Endozoicomonas gorgoniicola TaxID=1234144 RepID=A0ABT3MR11_9GAMM|nr:hypothetical protein [Endozoicomonas gorgoniicola]MCW7551810.1 hypothetical protein [Endozoicomonas gorgoniicola]MCW7552974.1 hypothetical protein [Endozoicomonas gorgoniicola]
MQDELNDLHQQVLATFGQPVSITQDNYSFETTGIISRELAATGFNDNVLQPVTVISLDRTLSVKRGCLIESGGQRWVIDRPLKDDGHLIVWNLHEDRS